MKMQATSLESIDPRMFPEAIPTSEASHLAGVVVDSLKSFANEKEAGLQPLTPESKFAIWAAMNGKDLEVRLVELIPTLVLKLKDRITDAIVVQRARVFPKYKAGQRIPKAFYFKVEDTPKLLRHVAAEKPFNEGVYREINSNSKLMLFSKWEWESEVSGVEEALHIKDKAPTPRYITVKA